MVKNKTPLYIAVAIFLIFCINNTAFSIENIKTYDKYPDYAREFTGKDTCEKFNRKLFIFNLKLNKYLIRPINIVWASIMPQYCMDRVKNVYNNSNYPVRLVGSVLQKDFKAAKQETVRFLTNTTIGLGGMYDPAKNHFKIEPRQEDIAQALAYHKKIKQGPYLVLPVLHGNVRDIVGQVLDYPLNPCSYALGPFAAIATVTFFVNNTTYMQPLVKKLEYTYPDPYEIARQYDGIEQYIKNKNLDRSDVFKQKTEPNIIRVNTTLPAGDLNPDIVLNNFKSQGPIVDSMRTALFEDQTLNYTIWADDAIWNRSFDKRIKTSSVSIDNKRSKYKFRYILQKNKNKISPLAIIYPSIGEGIRSDHSTILAKILYDEGYSVVIQGSSFHWEFVKSMPITYKPGLPAQDAQYLRLVTSNIINTLQNKNGYKFNKRIMIGSSFGALTALFVAAEEEHNNTLNVSNYISINPPIRLFFAENQLDKYCQEWKNNPSDIKMRAAITAEKVLQTAQNISDKKIKKKSETFSFTDDEAKLIIGFIMKQKLSDVVFAIENVSKAKKSNFYNTINKMSYMDYAQKYLFVNETKPVEQFDYETSLYSISDFLQNSNNYKIYHAIDDYFTNPEQLIWLKKQTNDKSVFFSNGSHLGFLYRKEFLDEFKKDTKLQKDTQPNKIPDKI